jgi:molecular chaperone HscB
MTYFELYESPVAFLLDEKALKRKFYQLSKATHPDFFTLETDEKQAAALEAATLNNEAYKVLSDFDLRMQYILEQKGIYKGEGQDTMPQDFLLSVMDINETLMELEFDFDAALFQKTKQDIENLAQELLQDILPTLKNYNNEEENTENLKKIKNFFFKRKYLLRIQNNISKFASL